MSSLIRSTLLRSSVRTYVTRSAQPIASRRGAFRCFSSAAADAKASASATQETAAPAAEETAETAAATEAAAEADAASADEQQEDPMKDQESVDNQKMMDEQLAKARDDALRSLAEMENVRTIARRDVKHARDFAVEKFAKSLLEVADNLSLAVQNIPDAVHEDKSLDPNFRALIDGVKMTESELQKTFGKFGVKRYGEIGEKFDPHFHEALFHMPAPGMEAGTVGVVLKTGYMIKDRSLRSAQVGVVQKAPEPTPEPEK